MTDLGHLIDETVAQTEREIVTDVRAGTVPLTVGSFSELHDYVDANEYGGLCDEGSWWGEQDMSPGSEALAAAGEMQSSVDAWLKAGGLVEALVAAESSP